MLDSGASHNLMPKAVMEKMGLDITRTYKELYSFDSRKVKCIGLIKDLCVTLAQIPAKSLVITRNPSTGHVLCYHPIIWSTKEII
jgi:hypothetical protein